MEAIETITVTSQVDPEIEVTVKIIPDEDPENPREMETLGTMVFLSHSRYELGDERTDDGRDFLGELCSSADPNFDDNVEYWENDAGWDSLVSEEESEVERRCSLELEPLKAKTQAEIDQLVAQNYDPFLGCSLGTYGLDEKIKEVKRQALAEADKIKRDIQRELSQMATKAADKHINSLIEETLKEHYVMLPLHFYEHNGITVRYGSPCCCWDDGQDGLIYVSKADIKKEYGDLSEESIQKAVTYLEGEVETYDQFCRCDIYGYVIEDENEMGHDSCWGFYGLDYAKKEALNAAKHVLKTLETEKTAVASDDSGARLAA